MSADHTRCLLRVATALAMATSILYAIAATHAALDGLAEAAIGLGIATVAFIALGVLTRRAQDSLPRQVDPSHVLDRACSNPARRLTFQERRSIMRGEGT